MLRFSPAEAAILAGTDVKAIHNAIDEILQRAAGPRRMLSLSDVVIVKAATSLTRYCTRDARKQVARRLKRAPRCRSISLDVVRIDVMPFRADVAKAMRTVRALRQLAVSDPKILGGEPVFKGTRIPVASIAKMLDAGESIGRIRGGYPSLTGAKIRLAPLWVSTYPRRGRPPLRPWAEEGRAPRKLHRVALKAGA